MLLPRQNADASFDEEEAGYGYSGFWFTKTGYAIKYAIFGTICLLFLAWFIGGTFHARRRMKQNLPPLAYHRWLFPREYRARFEPRLQAEYAVYQIQTPYGYQPWPGAAGYYGQGYPPPPPAYNNQDVPPTYQPPPGASKVAPEQQYPTQFATQYATQSPASQNFSNHYPPSPLYAPPLGPPPTPGFVAPEGQQTNGVISQDPAPPAQAHTGTSNPYRL
ncbi:uncharacterized protein K452DRAFT_294497 [Aplosporella prunicola CBS 121167]|uniref:Uncharacterized protein n=1 Tax=Aplosporella prunicola CBS 121167 TaxID=1176127 RepID=A0A6A6BSA9_9PEZI|nr:uncharacterized protein K452DRAFT_294497 [Aplosporella prunicola CBS 121167]KAF2146979.1 hypothetical protein K452DRAFT_294497 [Aplosporella prunicola CBS 121167]